MVKSSLFFLLVLSISACVSLPSRKTASEEDRSNARASHKRYKESEAQYYINLLPKIARQNIAVTYSFLQQSRTECASSDYGPYLDKKQSVLDTEQFLLKKLNRPFYFISINRDSYMGALNDAKEMICASSVIVGSNSTNDEPTKFNGSAFLQSHFAEELLKLPNTNFVVIEHFIYLQGTAADKQHLVPIIFNHPALTPYGARDFLLSLFSQKRNRLSEKQLINIFPDIISSPVFRQHPEFLGVELIDQLSQGYVSAETKEAIISMLLDAYPRIFNASDILPLILTSPIQQRNYSDFYIKLTRGLSDKDKVEPFLLFMNSTATFSGAKFEFDRLILELGYEPFFNFVLDEPAFLKRFSLPERFSIISQAIESKNLNLSQLNSLILSLKASQLPKDQQVYLLKNIVRQGPFNADFSLSVLLAIRDYINSNPSFEKDLFPIADGIGQKYFSNANIRFHYLFILDSIPNNSIKLQRWKWALENYQLEDGYLGKMLTVIYSSTDPNSIDLLFLILKQRLLSATTLSGMINTIINPKFSSNVKTMEIARAIAAHPKANDDTKKKARQIIDNEAGNQSLPKGLLDSIKQ